MSFGYSVLGFGAHPNRGTPPLSISLDASSSTIQLATSTIPPDQSQTRDSNSGDIDVTATASGGDTAAGYSYAWTVTETADATGIGGADCSVLVAGTVNTAQYNTLTVRVTQPALIGGGGPIFPPPVFIQATYRLRCTVSDGTDSVLSDHTLTVQAI
jgi:hypothetical protein